MRIRKQPHNNYWAIFNNGQTMRFFYDPQKPIPPLEKPEIEDVAINSVCLANCPYCFVPGTQIVLLDGKKNIEEVSIGDKIYCRNDTGELFESVIEQLHTREFNGDIIEIELNNGTVLSCTPNHKIYTQRGEIKAEDLTDNDEVYCLMS